MIARLVDTYVSRPAVPAPGLDDLTDRELDVLVDGPGTLQRRRRAVPRRDDRQDPRRPDPGQTRRPGPGAGGGRRASQRDLDQLSRSVAPVLAEDYGGSVTPITILMPTAVGVELFRRPTCRKHIDTRVDQAILVAGYCIQPSSEDEPVPQDTHMGGDEGQRPRPVLHQLPHGPVRLRRQAAGLTSGVDTLCSCLTLLSVL